MIPASQNEAYELEAPSKIFSPTTHQLKNESTYQLGRIPVIFNLCVSLTKLNGALTQNCKSHFLHDIQNLYEPQNRPKNGSYTLFFNKIYYFALLIKRSVLMVNHLDSWIEKSCSPQGKRQLVELYFKETEPTISPTALSALIDMFFYYSTKNEFATCIKKLENLMNYKKSKIKEILQELEKLNFILKRRAGYFSSEDSLVIQLINIEPLSNLLREKPLPLLATYVKTETLHARGMEFKVAVFKDVHDLENTITIKTDRISYDDETSGFLKKINAGDVISFTPSINKPTIKGIKHPLNLKIHTKAETEDDMTFFGEFDGIEEKTREHHGLTRCAWFTHVANTDFSIKTPITSVSLKPNCLNSQALEHMEKGDLVIFKARVSRRITNEGKEVVSLKDIHSILPRDEYYNNYGATA